MRLVIQRVSKASVSIEGVEHGSIATGLLVLVGICDADTDDDVEYLAQKVVKMRLFPDEAGVMNLSVCDVPEAGVLIVSQFTLLARTRKGNRPSYIFASRPERAIPLYEKFVARVEELLGHKVTTGVFGADMQVALVNDGPVTIIMDSQQRELF